MPRPAQLERLAAAENPLASNLRIQGFRFAKELLRDEGLVVGLLDARYTQDEIDDLNADPAGDAASDAISSAFKAALMDYMRTPRECNTLSLFWRTVPARMENGRRVSFELVPLFLTSGLSGASRVKG